jgi:hypothetical protein
MFFESKFIFHGKIAVFKMVKINFSKTNSNEIAGSSDFCMESTLSRIIGYTKE